MASLRRYKYGLITYNLRPIASPIIDNSPIKVWKEGTALRDPVLLQRAQKRYEWANKAEYSNLWLGDGKQVEANVGNGLVDWRDGGNYDHKAEDWQRFVDTSSYFIQVTLMIVYHTDTKFAPE